MWFNASYFYGISFKIRRYSIFNQLKTVIYIVEPPTLCHLFLTLVDPCNDLSKDELGLPLKVKATKHF